MFYFSLLLYVKQVAVWIDGFNGKKNTHHHLCNCNGTQWNKYNIYIYINSYVCVLCGQMSGDSGISAFPEEDNILCWKGTIAGSKDTVFEGTEYKLSLSFPNDYPFKPPNVKFETTCFHPNVDVHGGNICLDILQVIIMPIAMSIHFLCRFQHNN